MAIYDTTFTAQTKSDPRESEIRELVAVEGIHLRVSLDLILWFEDHGYQVDLYTGVAMKVEIIAVTAAGRAVNHLLTPVTEQEIEATVNSLFGEPVEACAPDGSLQQMIDLAHKEIDFDAELEDYLDAGADDRWHASGRW